MLIPYHMKLFLKFRTTIKKPIYLQFIKYVCMQPAVLNLFSCLNFFLEDYYQICPLSTKQCNFEEKKYFLNLKLL